MRLLTAILLLSLAACGPAPDLELEHAQQVFPFAQKLSDFYFVGRPELGADLPAYWRAANASCSYRPGEVPKGLVFVFREPDARYTDGRGYLAGELFMPSWVVEQGKRSFPGSVIDGHMAVNGWADLYREDRLYVIWANAETPGVVEHELCHLFRFLGGDAEWGKD